MQNNDSTFALHWNFLKDGKKGKKKGKKGKKPEICHDCTSVSVSASAISEFFGLALTSRKNLRSLSPPNERTLTKALDRLVLPFMVLYGITWYCMAFLWSFMAKYWFDCTWIVFSCCQRSKFISSCLLKMTKIMKFSFQKYLAKWAFLIKEVEDPFERVYFGYMIKMKNLEWCQVVWSRDFLMKKRSLVIKSREKITIQDI